MRALVGLYPILDAEIYGDELLVAAAAFVKAEVCLIQYRAKQGVEPRVLLGLRELTAMTNTKLIVNDDLEAAAFADGVHLGQDDLRGYSLTELRQMLPDKIIGISCHTLAQAQAVEDADYLGVGPYLPTKSKKVERAPLGLSGTERIARRVKTPVCAIGGVGIEHVETLRSAGVSLVAAIGSLAHSRDRYALAMAYSKAFQPLVSDGLFSSL